MTSKVEQYINDYTRGCSNELCSVEDRYGKKVISYHEWLTPDNARAVTQIAKEETIEKACEWINLHIGELSDIYTRSAIRNEFLEDFRKAMEE